MRRILSAILTVTGLIQGICIPVYSQNLNEDAIPGWNVVYSDNANGSVYSEAGRNEGNASVLVKNSSTEDVLVTQKIETQPGKKYDCIAVVKTVDLKGGYLFGENSRCNIKLGTNDWATYKFMFVAKENTSEIGIVANNTGNIIVDDFCVMNENGEEIAVKNFDFNAEMLNTSSSSTEFSNNSNINENEVDWENIPMFYSTQKNVPLFFAEGIKIDGNPSEWKSYPSVYMPAEESQIGKLVSWDGYDDLSANVYMAQDDDAFYLCAIVTDDMHYVRPEVYWAADCIQLGFTDNGSYGPEIGLYFDSEKSYIDSPIGKEDEMTFVAKRDGNTSIYEYKIPWNILYSEKPKNEIIFNVLVNDGDNNVRQAFIEWTPGIGYSKSPDSITMKFIPKENNEFGQWIEAPAQMVVNDTQEININFLNRGSQDKKYKLKIAALDFEDEVEIKAGSLVRVPVQYTAKKLGTAKIIVAVEGEDTSHIEHSIKIIEKDKYQNLDLTNIEGGKLKKIEDLITQCKEKGISTVYEELDLNVIKRFSSYYYDDISLGQNERATYVANNLERIADETIANLSAYLDGSKQSFSVPKYTGGDLEIKGYNVYSETTDSLTGEIEKRPVFLAGYGHTGQAIEELGVLPEYGTSICQFETGPRHIITGYSNTPNAENVVDRFLYNDTRINEYKKSIFEVAKESNQAVDFILSPHYFPSFVQEKYPETIAPNQGGMNARQNFYAEKAKEVIEAHVRYLLDKIKDEPALRSICLTNEPALDVRNCYELGNLDNPVTVAWIEYLEENYGTISKLNKYYQSDYANFDEVPLTSLISNDIPSYDFVVFNNKMFADWHKWLAEIVHEIIPDIPVHSKIMNTIYSNAVLPQGTDHELFAEFCQYSGNDAYFCYPTSSPIGKLAWYDFQNSMKAMPVFDSENHIITDGDNKFVKEHAYQNSTDLWQGALHGRALTTIWVWGRQETGVLEGSLLFRPDVVSKLGKTMLDMNRCSYEIAAINDEPFKVAVLYSWVSRIYDSSNLNATSSAYAGASYSGEKSCFITEKQLSNREFKNLDIIIVPYVPNVMEETVEGLKEFMDQGGTVLIMGGTSLTQNERKEKIRSDSLKYIQENAVYIDKDRTKTPTANNIADILISLYNNMEDIGNVHITNAKTGETVRDVEWRSTDYNGHKIVNICNYTWEENREVYLTVNGKRVTKAYDIKSGEELDGYISLRSHEPRLLRIDELSDIAFEDTKGHWAEKEIDKMTLKNVLNGVSNTEFMPDKEISAQELLMALIRYNGENCEYSEVFEKSKALWNIPDRLLDKEVLTREMVAELICMSCNIKNISEDISFFSDADKISKNAYDAMATLYSMGVMTGRSEKTIDPKDVLTRAEAVTVLSRLG